MRTMFLDPNFVNEWRRVVREEYEADLAKRVERGETPKEMQMIAEGVCDRVLSEEFVRRVFLPAVMSCR